MSNPRPNGFGSQSVSDLWNELTDDYREEQRNTPLRAIIFGPRIEASKRRSSVRPKRGLLERFDFLRALFAGSDDEVVGERPSVRLRREILRRCRGVGIATGIRPEEPALIEAAKDLFGDNYDLCKYEYRLVKRSDFIVILPDSPGSFAEFGLFSSYKSICEKSLILFDRRHQDDDSYIMHGPLIVSEGFNSTVRFVDYGDVDEGWNEVVKFAEAKRADKIEGRIRG